MIDKTNKSNECIPLHKFTEDAYLNYSMYVIMDRALPFIGDGLKPVQRRIIYAMSELGLNFNAKYKKSARTVGDVLGKYHPHGDTACYESIVLMAQPFSYRYPLIDGQGNWGAPDDPKSFAAMRYTESRLSKYADVLLMELNQGTVDYVPNFDGSLKEPKTLPARLPNILLNGTTGIAVGMATDIPPHNINEIAHAVIAIINYPNITLKQLLKYVQGPDFPTCSKIIISKEDLYKLYQTGRGSVRMRALWEIEDNRLIITALPHQVSGTKVSEQIAIQMREKKLNMLEDLRDESDQNNPTRLVIIPRSKRIDLEQIMNHLFATTDLERSYRVNMNMIGLDGRPSVKNLQNILKEWLIYRRNTIRRRMNFRMDNIINRLHILNGLQIVHFNLNKVIKIIRTKKDPKKFLIEYFELSNIQANAILELKLLNLKKLEEIEINLEKIKLEKEKDYLMTILSSEKKLNNLIKKEIKSDAILYGDSRRSPIVEPNNYEKTVVYENTSIFSEPITVIISEKGWIRSIKGHDINPKILKFRSGDNYKLSVRGKTNQPIIIIDSTGRSYTIFPQNLSIRGQGVLLKEQLILPPCASIEVMFTTNCDENQLLLASDAGYGFICNFKNIVARNKKGKSLLSLPINAKIINPIFLENSSKNKLLAITKFFRLLIFSIKDLPKLSKGKGKKMIDLSSEEERSEKNYIIGLYLISSMNTVIISNDKETLSLTPEDLKKFIDKCGSKGHRFLPNTWKYGIKNIEIK